jgi:glycosyltransferase involved in cell wall biosynthesis
MPRSVPAHDVVIFAPRAFRYYEREGTPGGGGAERQMFLLAHRLAERGLKVAHFVYEVADPVIRDDAPVTLVQAPHPKEYLSKAALAARLREVWTGLSRADAAVQVIRGWNGTLGVAGAWTRLHGRRLVFSGANISDFTDGAAHGRRDPRKYLFSAGIRMTDAVVVQTDEQVELAQRRFPYIVPPRQINSFAEPGPAPEGPGEAFLWVSRIVDYKRPMLYLDLAEAVPEARFWMIPIQSTDEGWSFDETMAEIRRRADALPNLEILAQRPHAELQEVVGRAIAIVNTSEYEGVPNTWLEGWARGIPALTFSFDPDDRIARNGIGISGAGSWDEFVAGARRLWERRADRGGLTPAAHDYARVVHGDAVADAWTDLVRGLAATVSRHPHRRLRAVTA